MSAAAVRNALVDERPDLAEALTDTFGFDRRNEVVDGQVPWYEMPVFFPMEGYVMASFVPEFIRSAQRSDGAPRLTTLHEEAFDAVKSLANDPDFKLEMDFRPGDIQFVNNLAVLHSRTEYEDWPELPRRIFCDFGWRCRTAGPCRSPYKRVTEWMQRPAVRAVCT